MTFLRRYRWPLFLSALASLLFGIGGFVAARRVILADAMQSKFEQIRPGMAVAEVRAIMEANPLAQLHTVDEDWYFDIWIWELGGHRIHVEFTQPPSRADERLPPESVAVDEIGKVKFKRFDRESTTLLKRLKEWVCERP
jgi:hypothetical protein